MAISKKHEIINKRRDDLKVLKKFAITLRDENLTAINSSGLKGWERSTALYNIKKLKNIVQEIKVLSTKEEVEKFAVGAILAEDPASIRDAQSLNKILAGHMRGAILFPQIARYSTVYSIGYDLNWLMDGTIQQHFLIANGIIKLEVLADEFHNTKFKKVKTRNKIYIKTHLLYKDYYEAINSSLERSKAKDYLGSTIICMTTIEGLVRRLNYFIFKCQNNSASDDDALNYAYTKFTSLESLILKSELQDDYPVSISEASILHQYIDDISLDVLVKLLENHKIAYGKIKDYLADMSELILQEKKSENIEEIKVAYKRKLDKFKVDIIDQMVDFDDDKYVMSIRVKLYFLIRRMKEYRNQLMHGQFISFNTKVKNYVVLSALLKVIDLLMKYDEIYKKQNSPNNAPPSTGPEFYRG